MSKSTTVNDKKTGNHKIQVFWKSIRLPVLAFITAFFADALLIILTDLSIYDLLQRAFSRQTTASLIGSLIAILLISACIWFGSSKTVRQYLSGKKLTDGQSKLVRRLVMIFNLALSFLLLGMAGYGKVFKAALEIAYAAYYALLEGSFGNIPEIIAAFRSGDIVQITESINPLSESLVAATPYILSALSVAVALNAGIFNIGTEGQIYIGALASVVAGVYLKGLPAIIHIPVSMLAGGLAGALWAGIPAILKTRFGSNEVINTIMLNYIAFKFVEYMLIGPLRRPDQSEPFSSYIETSAELTRFLPYPNRFHIGFFIAVAVAIFMYWFLFRTPAGLEIRLVGRNPNASRYAGINIKNRYILAFLISGMMAGLAGANEILGVNHYLSSTISPGYGYDSISLSILGNNHPIGIIFTSLMFGFLRNGSTRMQNLARVPIEIITIMQALIIGFIAAPAIIQKLFHIKEDEKERIVVTRGWGK